MGIFWEIRLINPPEVAEVKDQVVDLLIYEWNDNDAKVSKFPIRVNKKIAANFSLLPVVKIVHL